AIKAPPRPTFNSSRTPDLSLLHNNGVARPRIVVSMVQTQAQPQHPAQKSQRQKAGEILADFPDLPQRERHRAAGKPALARRSVRALVAAMIIIAFAGMLLATHFYVSRRRGQSGQQQSSGSTSLVGREGKTTRDANLRPEPTMSKNPVGIAEQGSRVKVLDVNNDWYEVQVIEHGRDKINPDSLDRGWVHKSSLVFN
ncbi:MAG: SH3 domain-containing protein, partial [Pyrinomonadaceae bacterium]|nr:SH3 domain-containing protein [Pyrinomonadaceae bacterium]